MKSYLINSITCNKGEEKYNRENQNIEQTANGKEKPPSSWYYRLIAATIPTILQKVYDDRMIENLQCKIHILITCKVCSRSTTGKCLAHINVLYGSAKF